VTPATQPAKAHSIIERQRSRCQRSEKFSGRSEVVCDTGKAEAAVAAAKDKAAAVKIGLIITRVPLFSITVRRRLDKPHPSNPCYYAPVGPASSVAGSYSSSNHQE